jgi:predicted transcriptional regulator of viral defense system
MTLTSIYALRDKALKSGRLVFDLRQLANLGLLPTDHSRVYASRLVEKGFAHRIKEGVISLTDDPLVVATQLVEPSYVSFTSALYLRDFVQQAPLLVQCVTTKNSFKLREPRIEYHRIVPELYYGYERMERYGSYVWVATVEKAILDIVYFGVNYKLVRSVDKNKLLSLAGPYGLHGGNRGKRVKKWVEKFAH